MKKNDIALLVIIILIVVIIFGGFGLFSVNRTPYMFGYGISTFIMWVLGIIFWILFITVLVLLIMWLLNRLKEDKKLKGEVKRKIHSFADAI